MAEEYVELVLKRFPEAHNPNERFCMRLVAEDGEIDLAWAFSEEDVRRDAERVLKHLLKRCQNS